MSSDVQTEPTHQEWRNVVCEGGGVWAGALVREWAAAGLCDFCRRRIGHGCLVRGAPLLVPGGVPPVLALELLSNQLDPCCMIHIWVSELSTTLQEAQCGRKESVWKNQCLVPKLSKSLQSLLLFHDNLDLLPCVWLQAVANENSLRHEHSAGEPGTPQPTVCVQAADGRHCIGRAAAGPGVQQGATWRHLNAAPRTGGAPCLSKILANQQLSTPH